RLAEALQSRIRLIVVFRISGCWYDDDRRIRTTRQFDKSLENDSWFFSAAAHDKGPMFGTDVLSRQRYREKYRYEKTRTSVAHQNLYRAPIRKILGLTIEFGRPNRATVLLLL